MNYLDENGETKTQDATVVTNSDSDTTWSGTEQAPGWYVVQGEVTIGGTVTVNGNVNLILADNASLTVNGSILVNKEEGSNNSFTIYAQSDATKGGNNTGSLTATGGTYAAGIGGGERQTAGAITIYGGDVTATGGICGAGIGGGYNGSGGAITITGGGS